MPRTSRSERDTGSAGRPFVISHRTHGGTMPENTLVGVRAALDAGADAIELDLRATADGVLVLLHDETLERTTGDPRPVAEVTGDALAAIEVRSRPGQLPPHRVPTLAEVFATVGGAAVVVVEVKATGIETLLADAIGRARAESWTWIWAFDASVARSCQRILPAVPVSRNVGVDSVGAAGDALAILDACKRDGLSGVSWDHRLVNSDLVEATRTRELATYCWTVNEPSDIARVIDAGVDGICSDFPERVMGVLGR